MLSADYFDRILDFVRSIGLQVEIGPFGPDGFLPGVDIKAGVLHIDPEHLYVSGDLLHEAGHIAVVPSRWRPMLGTNLETSLREALGDTDDPMARIALDHTEPLATTWAYAAVKALELPVETLFYAGGYRMTEAQRTHFVASFEAGNNFGILHMAKLGMTGPCGIMSMMHSNDLPPFPIMTRWLQV